MIAFMNAAVSGFSENFDLIFSDKNVLVRYAALLT